VHTVAVWYAIQVITLVGTEAFFGQIIFHNGVSNTCGCDWSLFIAGNSSFGDGTSSDNIDIPLIRTKMTADNGHLGPNPCILQLTESMRRTQRGIFVQITGTDDLK
jgi:hypothetical protein